MLAAMRPVQHYQQVSHAGHERSASRTSNHSNNDSPSASPSRGSHGKQGEKGQRGGASRSSKKAASSSLSKEVETAQAIEQTKPGLITLSKPLDGNDKKARGRNQQTTGSSSAAAGDEEAAQSTRPRTQRKKKLAPGVEEIKGADAEMLSRSAPTAHSSSQDHWDMPTGARGEERGVEAPLTWQQQMIGSMQPASTPDRKKTGKKAAGKKPAATPTKETLTWQQELLSSNKSRGPSYDVFADAKDEATFGSQGEDRRNPTGPKKQVGGGRGGAGRQRADSVGEMRLQAKGPAFSGIPGAPLSSSMSGPNLSGIDRQPPSTPNNKFAYAGPNFHNSPSPATLPVPKFLQPKGGAGAGETAKLPNSPFAREAMLRSAANESGQSNDGDASTSSEEWEEDMKRRSVRGVTAPPELQSSGNEGDRSITIESLLAKMMRAGDGS